MIWDSERELLYNDIAHVLQNTKKNLLNKLDDSNYERRITSWIYESATEFSPCSYRIFIPWASRGPSADICY